MQEFESTLASLKNKRRRDDNESTEIDEILAKLESDMRMACMEDAEANKNGRAATSKLKMLNRVLAVLEKSVWHDQIMENELLGAVRMWLEPLPDGSLPSLDIRRNLLFALNKMPITTEYLRESRIGRVVMFMYKCEKEVPELRKMAGELINKWSRPILARAGRSTNVLDLLPTSPVEGPRPMADEGFVHALRSCASESFFRSRNRVGDRGYVTKRAVIPQVIRSEFKVVPKSVVDFDDMKSKSESGFRNISQQLNKSRIKVDRKLNKISVQGRDKAF